LPVVMSSVADALWKTFQLHRDHPSGDHEKLITITSESVIITIPER